MIFFFSPRSISSIFFYINKETGKLSRGLAMKKEFFIRFSLYAASIAIIVLIVMSLFSYIDITQQYNKVLIALMAISLMGGFFGTFISEHST
jgi:hypothetical protein